MRSDKPSDDLPVCKMEPADIDAAISALEDSMESLQSRHPDVFTLASAWAREYDAIVAATPEQARAGVEQRLQRIGIRWGVAKGARITGQIQALKP